MSVKPLSNIKKRIADGLSAWLAFEFACERGYLFSEYYLAHALGQILRGHDRNVRGEEPHPTLAVAGETGRPPSLDFVVFDDGQIPTLAVETKWAGYSDVTAGALIWDAFRLEAFHRATGAPGLLILAGTKAKIRTFVGSAAFHRTKVSSAGNLVPLLPLPDGSRKFVLPRSVLPTTVREYVDKRISVSPPQSIAEHLYCEVPHVCEPPGPQSLSFSVYVWEVRSHA